MNPVTPEIQEVINSTINSAFYKIGLWWFLAILLVGVLLYLAIQMYLAKRFKKFEADLKNAKTKDIEIWKQQKELMFSFVKFLEEKFFNNPDLKETDPEKLKKVKSKFFAELNTYYGQLYLVMETSTLKKINEYIQGTTSPVQRFYLYKELRKQLMQVLYEKFTDEDYPFVKGDASKAVVIKNGKSELAKNFDELKKSYPFIDEYEDGYKALPFFAEGLGEDKNSE